MIIVSALFGPPALRIYVLSRGGQESGRCYGGRGSRCVEQMNVLIHCYMDRSSALLEGEVCYIEVSVVRKGVTQQAAQGCSRQQQPIGGLDILYLNNFPSPSQISRIPCFRSGLGKGYVISEGIPRHVDLEGVPDCRHSSGPLEAVLAPS